ESDRDGVWGARLMGCAFGTLAVALVGLLGHHLGGARAGRVAALLAALYPSAIGMSVIVLSEALFLPLMVAHLLLWRSAWISLDARWRTSASLFAGAVAGAAVLTRPSWLLFAPFLFAVAMIFGGDRRRHAW